MGMASGKNAMIALAVQDNCSGWGYGVAYALQNSYPRSFRLGVGPIILKPRT